MIRTLLLLLTAVACHRGPHWEVDCVKSHSQTTLAYWPPTGGVGSYSLTPMGAGFHMGGGMHLVTRSVCDMHDSTWVSE